jgi:NRPS condensation-like uncharacterized protein
MLTIPAGEKQMAIPDRFVVTTQAAYNYAASKFFADQQLCMILGLNGKIDEAVLARAVRLTLDLEPVLGCCFVENCGKPFWSRRSDLDHFELCKVSDGGSFNDFVNEAVRADVDPLVMVRVFREDGADIVCVKVNHSACDAGGLKQYVHLLSSVYSMLVAGEECSLKPNFGRRDQTQIFERVKPSKSALHGFPTPTWALPQEPDFERLHSFRVIPKTEFVAMKNYARRRKATITDVLLTAFYRLLFDLNSIGEDKPMINQVSIDLRRYLQGGKAEAICNLSVALYMSLERKRGETFESTLQRVREALNKVKEDSPGVDSARGLEYLYGQGYNGLEKYLSGSAEMGRKFNVTFPLLSNFGVLPDYQFGDLKLMKAYISSPIMYPPGLMPGFSTFNDEMTLSIGYCGQQNSLRIDRFINAYVAELPH